jgi:hypothetical protein
MKTLLVSVAAAATLYAGAAFAQAEVSAEVSIDEISCSVFDGNGDIKEINNPAIGGDAMVQAVLTPSGNSKISCSGSLPLDAAPALGRAVVWDFESTGIMCSTTYGLTTDWHNVVTKSGRVTLTCHVTDGTSTSD